MITNKLFFLDCYSTPWTELKSTTTVPPSTSKNVDLTKSEREAKCLFTTTRTQDALSKWIQTQFKDNLQAIDGIKGNLSNYFVKKYSFLHLSSNTCSIIKRY